MARFLFWNLQKKPLVEQVADIVREHGVDFLVLAEIPAEREAFFAKLLCTLNGRDSRFHFHPSKSGSASVELIATVPERCVVSVADDRHMTFRRITPVTGSEFLLVGVHLPSKLCLDSANVERLCPGWSQQIEEEEERIGHSRTLLVGDLNMNPFDAGIVSGLGFHAVSTRERAKRAGGRRISGQMGRRSFYNPMWSHLGDRHKHAPGSYYYSGRGAVEYFWHMFDQVLIRPALLSAFPDDQVHILTAIGSRSLLKRTGIPSERAGSDHLPLLFDLNFERNFHDG